MKTKSAILAVLVAVTTHAQARESGIGWVVCNPPLEGNRQLARRVHFAKKGFRPMPGRRFGRGRTCAGRRPPGRSIPKSRSCPAVQDDDRPPRFDSGEVLNQLVLEFRERELAIVAFPFVLLAEPC